MKLPGAILLVCLLVTASHGQQTYTIKSDGSGKLIGQLPEMLFNNDQLTISIEDASEDFSKFEKTLKDQLVRSKKQLQTLKADAEKMEVLATVYGILPGDIDAVIAQLDAVYSDPYTAAQSSVPVFTVTDRAYFTFIYGHGRQSFVPSVESGPHQLVIGTPGLSVRMLLEKKEPYQKLVYNWLQGTKADFPGNINRTHLLRLRALVSEKITSLAEKINSLDALLSQRGRRPADNFRILQGFKDEADRLVGEISQFITTELSAVDHRAYKDWVLKWMWYQSTALPKLNPFNFKREEELGPEPDTSSLPLLRIQAQAKEKYYNGLDMRRFRIGQIDSMLAELSLLQFKRDSIIKAYTAYQSLKAKNEQAMAAFGTTSHQLNDLLMVGGTEKKDVIYWQRHHDAASAYQLMTRDARGEYRDDDRVVILSHNLKPGQSATISLTYSDITDDASQLTGLLAGPIGTLFQATQSLSGFGSIFGAASDSLATVLAEATQSLNNLKQKLSELRSYARAIDYLLQQSNPELNIRETVNKEKTWHSEISNPAKPVDGPKKVVYKLSTTTKEPNTPAPVVDSFSYRINKRYRIFPMAGAFYTTNNFSEINNDRVEELAHTRIVVGLKVYLHKTDIRNGAFITGRDEHGKPLLWSRWSIQTAFDVQKPLRNLYLGTGFDLWPGFCLSAGAVANRYSYKEFVNGQAVRTGNRYRAGFYLGVSTDITLFTDVAKFLNFSKD